MSEQEEPVCQSKGEGGRWLRKEELSLNKGRGLVTFQNSSKGTFSHGMGHPSQRQVPSSCLIIWLPVVNLIWFLKNKKTPPVYQSLRFLH